jgi:hypothetical protein
MIKVDVNWGAASEIEAALGLAIGLLDAYMPPGAAERPVLDVFSDLLQPPPPHTQTVGKNSLKSKECARCEVCANKQRELQELNDKFRKLAEKYATMLLQLKQIKKTSGSRETSRKHTNTPTTVGKNEQRT